MLQSERLYVCLFHVSSPKRYIIWLWLLDIPIKDVQLLSQSPSCKVRGAASSGRPGGGRGEEKTRPSVAVLQQFSSTRVFPFK